MNSAIQSFEPLSPASESEDRSRQPESPRVMELTILMTCLNEAKTVGICIYKAKEFLSRANIAGEVVVADNGSVDGSIEIAEAMGARVVRVAERGYGAALIGGIEAARGE